MVERRPHTPRIRKRLRARSGYTLLELMVVAGIVGLLVSIAVPNFQISQDKARNANMIGNCKVLQSALLQYSSEHEGAFPKSPDTSDTGDGSTDYSPAGSGLAAYLPGGIYPRSPWSSEPQVLLLAPGGDPLNSAKEVAAEDGMVKRVGTIIGAGSISSTDSPNAPPSRRDHYGALLYSRDPDKQVVLVYGVGKKFADAIVAFGLSNDGAAAGGQDNSTPPQ